MRNRLMVGAGLGDDYLGHRWAYARNCRQLLELAGELAHLLLDPRRNSRIAAVNS